MKRSRALAILSGCALLTILASALWPREPTYEGKSLSSWLGLLPAPNRGFLGPRQAAQDAVIQIGTNGLPYMLRWMRYDPPPWRRRAVVAVDQLPNGFPGRKRLLEWLRGKNESLRASAVAGLATLGTNASPAIPELTLMMQNWKTEPYWTNALYVLAFMGDSALPPLIGALTNRNYPSTLRYWASDRLAGVRSTNVEARFTAWTFNLPESDEVLAFSAARHLYINDAHRNIALPALIRCAKSTNTFVASRAVRLITDDRNDPNIVVPVLLRALQHPDVLVAQEAAMGLGNFRNSSSLIVPVLITNLASSRQMVRYAAAKVLGSFGKSASPAIPLLLKAQQDPDPSLRRAASSALLAIPEYAISNLVSQLANPNRPEQLDQSVPRAEFAALCGFDEQARAAVPALLQRLDSPDIKVAARAAITLGNLGFHDWRPVPVLTDAVQSTNMALRVSGLIGLMCYGTNARSSAPLVYTLLDDPSEMVRRCATNTLWKIAPAR